MKSRSGSLLLAMLTLGLSACGERATLPVSAGIGPEPALPPPKPADWTSEKVQKQTDGELFWKITNGRVGAMPSHQGLSDVERWQMVNFIRALARE